MFSDCTLLRTSCSPLPGPCTFAAGLPFYPHLWHTSPFRPGALVHVTPLTSWDFPLPPPAGPHSILLLLSRPPFLCQSVSCAFHLGPSDASRLELCKDGSSQVDSGDSTHIRTRRPGRTPVPTPASGPFLPSSRSCRRVVFLPQSLCTRWLGARQHLARSALLSWSIRVGRAEARTLVDPIVPSATGEGQLQAAVWVTFPRQGSCARGETGVGSCAILSCLLLPDLLTSGLGV